MGRTKIVSPLGVKATPKAVPATPHPAPVWSSPDRESGIGDHHYCDAACPSLLVATAYIFISALLPPTHFPMQFKSPEKTILTDLAHCPCPCLDGDFRPGCHRSQWLHLDGLHQQDRFLPLISSAVAKHVADCMVPSWSLLCRKSLQTTPSRCCGHGWGPVYG